MNIDLSVVVKSEGKEIIQSVQAGFDSFRSRMGDFPITRKAPIELRIANRENAELLISGTVDMTVSIPCSRCLEEVETPIRFDIDRRLRMEGDALLDDETEDADYLIGLELDVEKFIYAEILVNWPTKVLCTDDCKGICKVCGTNLNKGACSCQRTELDPRMAAIQDIFNGFKEV